MTTNAPVAKNKKKADARAADQPSRRSPSTDSAGSEPAASSRHPASIASQEDDGDEELVKTKDIDVSPAGPNYLFHSDYEPIPSTSATQRVRLRFYHDQIYMIRPLKKPWTKEEKDRYAQAKRNPPKFGAIQIPQLISDVCEPPAEHQTSKGWPNIPWLTAKHSDIFTPRGERFYILARKGGECRPVSAARREGRRQVRFSDSHIFQPGIGGQ
ncbi:uncharacterized protein LTR77_010559 [Saxophila tyrrhenica]|uniref:Uncharacterized protein n=1 Tax=Saxophila tyrrhenica TaxID=1690608 RepID=A0AAV9NWU8_9PEZI|nr:hypothetical protein LTR77_010559 [Saxophila tyrrhenica]